MKFTRRGLFGLLGGAAAAKAIDVKWLDAAALHEPVHRPVQGFKITLEMGPPFISGDVVRSLDNGMTFLVKHAEAPRVTMRAKGPILGTRGSGEPFSFTKMTNREGDPGWKTFEKVDGRHERPLVLVSFLNPGAKGMLLSSFDEKRLFRVGRAYMEGGATP